MTDATTRLAEIAEREAFEEEHRLMFELRSAAYDRCNGRYIDYRTEHDFRVWQAAKATERSASADWEPKFKAHTEAVQAFLAEMMAVYDPCAGGEMPVREVCAFLIKQATDDRQRFYDQEAQLTAAQARSREDAELIEKMVVDAFDLGFSWARGLQGQNLEDSRAVGRTLQSYLFSEAGLTVNTDEWDSFTAADIAICEGKRRIKAALVTKLRARADELEGRA